jgi:branched-chain amino acid transport system substrate-binding protein
VNSNESLAGSFFKLRLSPLRLTPGPVLALAILIALISIVSSSCIGAGGRGDRTIIRIGYYGDLSGPTFNFGASARNGVLMAADEINQAGGIDGRKIDVVIEDDQGKAGLAAASISKLVQEGKVIAVIGGGTSNNFRAAAPEAQAARVPLIAPSATDPQVTQVGDYIFRTCFVDAFQGEVMARFAANTLKAKKAGILLDFNSSYSRGLSDFFELSFSRLGGQVVSKQLYTAGDRDYRGQLNALREVAPDVIFIPGYYEDVALMAKQARQIGITQALLGADGWDAPELWDRGGDALNGSYISSHYSAEDQAPLVQKFVKNYKERYGNLLPDAHAALGYDSLRVVAEAIGRSGAIGGAKLRDELAATKGFSGVTGVISMNGERNAVKPAVVLRLQDRRFIYQETIQPDLTAPAAAPASLSPPPARPKPKR